MRTTLTLEPDVAERVRQEVRRKGKPMKQVVNEALRRGLGIGRSRVRPRRFHVEPHDFGIRPGIDLDRMNQLIDELEVAHVARKLKR